MNSDNIDIELTQYRKIFSPAKRKILDKLCKSE